MRTPLHILTRFGVCLLFAAPMVLPWTVGLRKTAILGLGLAITTYLVLQGFTGFRHPLHGALLVTILALIYAFLVPAFGGARRLVGASQRAFNHRPALDTVGPLCLHSDSYLRHASEAERSR